MVSPIKRKAGSRPIEKDQIHEYINRELQPLLNRLVATLNLLLTRIVEGEGDPDNVVTADKGAIYMRTDGTPGTLLYMKTTDGDDTGWIAFA